MTRRHTALSNRKAINWADQIAVHEEEAAVVDDEVEAALEIELDAPGSSGGSGAVSYKRADTAMPKFRYGSSGSGGDSGTDEEFEFGSAGGGSGLTGPSPVRVSGSGRTFLDGAGGGFRPGDTPALNTALARHGRIAVRRAVGNVRRGS